MSIYAPPAEFAAALPFRRYPAGINVESARLLMDAVKARQGRYRVDVINEIANGGEYSTGRDRWHLHRAAERLAKRGFLVTSNDRRGWYKLWLPPYPMGSDAATAVEIGVDMLMRGLLELASWIR